MGTLMFLTAPKVFIVDGRIESVRVEKTRPPGFEDIHVDSDNPDHAGIPVNTTTYGVISYSFEGRDYRTEIMSWYDDTDWKAGATGTFYVVEDEPDIPHETLPGEVRNGKQQALIAGLAMSAMGAVFLIISLWQISSEKKKGAELAERIRKIKKQNYIPAAARSSKTILEAVNRGNLMVGIIVTLVGSIFLGVGIMEILTQGELEKKLLLAFPAMIGTGLLFVGLSEFYKETVTVSSLEVRCVRRALRGGYDETRRTSSFAGIDENILERVNKGSLVRSIFKEQVLVHEENRFNGLSLKLIPDDEKALSASRALAAALGLPRIIHDGKDIRLDYPEEQISLNEDRDAGNDEWSPSAPFPAKYLKLVRFEGRELEMTRPYGKSTLWGIAILGLGIFIAVVTGTPAILFPFVMMGLIFTGIGLKREVFCISGGIITLKRSYAGKIYSSQEIPLMEIQEIRTGNDARLNGAECLEINGRHDRILFGQAAGAEELIWLKNCIKYLKT